MKWLIMVKPIWLSQLKTENIELGESAELKLRKYKLEETD